MKKNANAARKRLTHAGKRSTITLGTVVIKITHNGRVIECTTAAEAITLLRHIDAEERKRKPTIHKHLPERLSNGTMNPWTGSLFWQFIESLGEAQNCVLSLLVRKHKVTDEELRKVLKLDSNQALAGVLSGVSKQAGALNISARSVYTVEDERKAGELTKTYAIANDFLVIAGEMNWPEQ